MMDWTDRHERYFLRLFSRHALLYTEMITSAALIHGRTRQLLQHDAFEHPLAIQLGGSDPAELASAAVMAEDAGYLEINLNVGCPSSKVQTGQFGACLMAAPSLVADCVGAMLDRVQLPVTIKCRIGIDDHDSDEFLENFVRQVSQAGCEVFIVHARLAMLQGLSPKQNREIPPLNYERVFRLKQRFPQLRIVLNGGITSIESALQLLDRVDGVMVGREAYQNPFFLSRIDELLFGEPARNWSRAEYLEAFLPYVRQELSTGTPLQHMSRHLLGLFRGEPGGRMFRRHLSEHAHKSSSGLEVLTEAMTHLQTPAAQHA